MYVNVAVLKETHPHERRAALVPSVVDKLTKLGAKLHMQSGAADAAKLTDATFENVAFIDDRKELLSDADMATRISSTIGQCSI
jgi:NAD(P) transhydrogenase subunit alpha